LSLKWLKAVQRAKLQRANTLERDKIRSLSSTAQGTYNASPVILNFLKVTIKVIRGGLL
jgi:hypothetical protein